MARVYLTPIDLQNNEILNAVLHNVPGAQGTTGQTGGLIHYRSDSGYIEWFNAVTNQWMTPGTGEIGDHEAAVDPHSQYLTETEGDTRYVNETDHTKAAHDAMNINADTVDGSHAADLLARTNHTGTQTAATISNFDTQVRTSRLDQMAAPTASVSLNNQKVISLAAPTSNSDAATKQYVDNAVAASEQGISMKAPVRAATTVNVTLSGIPTIDGIATVVGNRILVKNQSTAAENGIYVIGPGPAYTWTRAADMDAIDEVYGAMVLVEEGTANGNTQWFVTEPDRADGGTLGTTAIVWTQFSSLSDLQAGSGLTKSGNTINVGAGDGISVAADAVAVSYGSPVALDGSAASGTATTVPRSDHKHALSSNVPRKYSATLAAGSASYTVTHNLGTRDVTVAVYQNSTPYNEVEVDVEHTDTNTITVTTSANLAADHRVVVVG